ncbi:hypothetical protein Y1Q_0023988 [Alligator mississippiensis]|uniref:SCAN box domain-containing protein n=1 Tax=Alligator mississippiensis TaxID=8496 RepID=A0A151P967_ALLMI|nr:hypothetical protein Y1Q_0023988 [Alligator mississippiensis]
MDLEAQRECEKVHLELKRMEVEAECLEREKTAQREVERQEAEAKCKHELEVLCLRPNGGDVSPLQVPGGHPKPNTSAFSHYRVTDNPDVFLSIFEKQAQQWKVPEEEFMMHMDALVEGNMALVLNNLPMEQAGDYQTFKEAVQLGFHLGPEVFHNRFCTTVPQTGKSMHEFASLI